MRIDNLGIDIMGVDIFGIDIPAPTHTEFHSKHNSRFQRQSVCLVINPVTVDSFNCTPEDRATDSVVAPTWGCLFWLVGTGALSSVVWST